MSFFSFFSFFQDNSQGPAKVLMDGIMTNLSGLFKSKCEVCCWYQNQQAVITQHVSTDREQAKMQNLLPLHILYLYVMFLRTFVPAAGASSSSSSSSFSSSSSSSTVLVLPKVNYTAVSFFRPLTTQQTINHIVEKVAEFQGPLGSLFGILGFFEVELCHSSFYFQNSAWLELKFASQVVSLHSLYKCTLPHKEKAACRHCVNVLSKNK